MTDKRIDALPNKNRTLGTELVQQPAADGSQHSADDTAGQQQTAGGKGISMRNKLRIVGN